MPRLNHVKIAQLRIKKQIIKNRVEIDNKSKINIKSKDINIPNARERGGKSRKRQIWIKKWIQ